MAAAPTSTGIKGVDETPAPHECSTAHVSTEYASVAQAGLESEVEHAVPAQHRDSEGGGEVPLSVLRVERTEVPDPAEEAGDGQTNAGGEGANGEEDAEQRRVEGEAAHGEHDAAYDQGHGDDAGDARRRDIAREGRGEGQEVEDEERCQGQRTDEG